MIKNYLTSLKQEFSGYNTAKLMKDIMAGLTVCAVALPLALAFGVSSGATAAAGLVTAIIAGVVIAVLGGASFQISGPTGAMSAVLVGIVASYGLQGVFFACFAVRGQLEFGKNRVLRASWLPPEPPSGAHRSACRCRDDCLAEKVGRTRAGLACGHHFGDSRFRPVPHGFHCDGGRHSAHADAR